MPQWSRDRSSASAKYPDERWQADCPADSVALLLRYDHHTVWLNGRRALLLTYVWAAERVGDDQPRRFDVSFTYAAGHPGAASSVQAVVDGLNFAPVSVSTNRTNER